MKLLIQGAGVIGLSLANEMALRGHKVTLIDSKKIGQGATGAGTGLLIYRDANVYHSRYRAFYVESIKKHYGSFIERLNKYENDLAIHRGGYTLFYTTDFKWNNAQEQFMREGALDYEVLVREKLTPYKAAWPKLPDIKAFRFKNEAWLHNSILLKALIKESQKLGVELIEEVKEEPISEGEGWRFQNQNYDVLNVSAGVYSKSILEKLGYASALKPMKGQVALINSISNSKEVLQVNDSFYMVNRPEGTLLGSTSELNDWNEDFNEFGEKALFENFENYFGIKDYKVLKTWAGLRPRTNDRQPYCGWIEKDKLSLSCGHFKNGLSMAPLNAVAMADLLEEKAGSFDLSPFTPMRKKGGLKRI